jgi:hypothetical protein
LDNLTYAMKAQYLLNGENIAYLIHGQPLEFEIKGRGCLFLLIQYNGGRGFWGRWSIQRSHTHYRSLANCYAPRFKVWGIGWGIRRLIDLPLHINFVNVVNMPMRCEPSEPERVMKPLIDRAPVQIDRPECKLASVIISSLVSKTPRLKNNRLQLIHNHAVRQ